MKVLLAHLEAARAAARELRSSTGERRSKALEKARELLLAREKKVLEANAQDLAALPKNKPDATPAFKDRLTLNSARVREMADSLRAVAELPDPVGEVVEDRKLLSGVRVRKVRSPLGVIFMIFESRPNVAVEAFSLALKSGNVMILRGGKESMQTTAALYEILSDALESQKLPRSSLWGITDPDRAITGFLLKQKQWIDVVVPRGGDGLIEYVVRESAIPIIKNDRGLCHVYVHEDADLEMAANIVVNAKVQRPGVCNSMETLLVHERAAAELFKTLKPRLSGVEIFAEPKALRVWGMGPGVSSTTNSSFDTEYLDLKMNVALVASLDEAIAHIERHGSRHSESIVTKSESAARRFQNEIDAAAVYWNASTRFTDGYMLGLGGEIGISTQKLHARGPVGLRELTSLRWIMDGEGQVRK